jgi:mono/diheme cytochrome c family protein
MLRPVILVGVALLAAAPLVLLKPGPRVSTPRARTSAGQPADAFYPTHIQPIFDQHCTSCHGLRKKKGGLVLESYADLAKGGDSGPAVAAGNLETSEMFRRINLPHEDEEFMPSDGKPPLEKADILLIKQWIMTGASPKTTLADLAAAGIELPKRAVPAGPMAPDYRKFAAQIKALEAKLPLRLIPVSQNVTDGLVLRTAAEVDKVDDAVVAQLAPVAPLIVDAELSRTRITNKSLAVVAKFTNLRRLDLAYTKVTSDGLGVLAPLAKLRTINLVSTAVDDSAAPALRRLGGLQEVHAFESKMSERMLTTLRTTLEERGKGPTKAGSAEKAAAALPSSAGNSTSSPAVSLTSKDAAPSEPVPKATPAQEAGGTDNDGKAP